MRKFLGGVGLELRDVNHFRRTCLRSRSATSRATGSPVEGQGGRERQPACRPARSGRSASPVRRGPGLRPYRRRRGRPILTVLPPTSPGNDWLDVRPPLEPTAGRPGTGRWRGRSRRRRPCRRRRGRRRPANGPRSLPGGSGKKIKPAPLARLVLARVVECQHLHAARLISSTVKDFSTPGLLVDLGERQHPRTFSTSNRCSGPSAPPSADENRTRIGSSRAVVEDDRGRPRRRRRGPGHARSIRGNWRRMGDSLGFAELALLAVW